MTKRANQVAKEIQKRLGMLIQEDFPETIISVFDVIISDDLMSAKIWIKILGLNVFSKILKKSDIYRYDLANSLKLRKTPELKFILVGDS